MTKTEKVEQARMKTGDIKQDDIRCYCALYMCPRSTSCTLKDAYLKKYPIEIITEDAPIPDFSKQDFRRIHKKFNTSNLFLNKGGEKKDEN